MSSGATTDNLPPGVLYQVKAAYKYQAEDMDELQFEVKYALMSSLAMHSDKFDLQKSNLVMMKNFTRSLMSSHTYKSS